MTAADADAPRVEIDGQGASSEQLREAALDSYGHFTAMQVRSGRVRGLDLHMARLDSANRELFGAGLESAEIRSLIRHALGDDTDDASVRVYIRQRQDQPSVMVTVRQPGGMPSGPWKLRSVPYQRSLAHIKHLADFGQGYYQRLARRDGFDEALLTGPDAVISEGTMTNIGFWDGSGVVWPMAPALQGITMQLLDLAIAAAGLSARHAVVRVPDMGSFSAAFVTNARGVAPVGQVDDRALPRDVELMRTLTELYQSAPWERI